MDVVDDGLQAVVVDLLPIVGGHGLIDMPYDRINGHLILAATGHGLERVTQTIESEARPLQVQALSSLMNSWVTGLLFVIRIFPVSGSGSLIPDFSQRCP